MKNRTIRIGIQALAISGSMIMFTACNSGDYTKNPATGSETTPAKTDTSSSTPGMTDTSSTTSGREKRMATTKKKGKVTVGIMNPKGSSSMKADKDGVYDVTETSPAYPGGQSAMEAYINNHTDYEQTAVDNNAEGTVDVQFVVDENGQVSDVKALGKKTDQALSDDAVKVVSGMPKWTPGKVKGKTVKTRIVLPVTYKMED